MHGLLGNHNVPDHTFPAPATLSTAPTKLRICSDQGGRSIVIRRPSRYSQISRFFLRVHLQTTFSVIYIRSYMHIYYISRLLLYMRNSAVSAWSHQTHIYIYTVLLHVRSTRPHVTQAEECNFIRTHSDRCTPPHSPDTPRSLPTGSLAIHSMRIKICQDSDLYIKNYSSFDVNTDINLLIVYSSFDEP